MRKLASIQRIIDIKPIENADNIELATVLGWHVVIAKKDNFHIGDLVVYIEIDSILPKENPAFAFLEGRRLRTKKLRGVYSQGIVFHIDTLFDNNNFKEGDDVTKQLGIIKYEPEPEVYKEKKNNKWYMKFKIGRWFWKKFLYKPSKKSFPFWIPKSDEIRIQVLNDIIEQYQGLECEFTEKVDGSSITFWLDEKGKLHVCSRNYEILDHEDVYYKTASKLIDNMKKTYAETIFQGELLGPKIQGNKYKLKDYKILVYNVGKKNNLWSYYSPHEVSVILKSINIEQVPILGTCTITNVDDLVKLSEGKSKLANIQREGIVVRPLNNIKIDSRFPGSRLSFKVINPKFLLKYE